MEVYIIMKKLLSIILAAFLMLGCLSGCGTAADTGSSGDSSEKKLSIAATIFPEYDWAREVLGEMEAEADVTLLIDSGTDMHSFQPAASDIVRIASCDLFIYVGGESDSWVEEVLNGKSNPNRKVINLLDVLGSDAKEEEIKEGMEEESKKTGNISEIVEAAKESDSAECDEAAKESDSAESDEAAKESDSAESDEGAKGSDSAESDEAENDEHVWLSLKNASKFVSAIADALAEIDADNADQYISNAAAYKEKLSALDSKYQDAVDAAAIKTLLFGDRFPFRYLADDYGLDYYAAFAGCSAETEASFETILFLAEKVDELGLSAVMTIDGSDDKIAKTIIENTAAGDQQILMLDSMQSITESDVEAGLTYISIMEENLDVLKDALQLEDM